MVGVRSRAAVAILSLGQPFCCLLLGAQIAAASRKRAKGFAASRRQRLHRRLVTVFMRACACESVCVSKILLYFCEIGAPGTHNFEGTTTPAPAPLSACALSL